MSAGDQRLPLDTEHLRQVLDKLNDVLDEAARLRKDVMLQLNEQLASQQQHVSSGKRKRPQRKR